MAPFFIIVFSIALLFCPMLLAQQNVDDRYLEDQFYVALGYNFLRDRPNSLIQRNLSYNLQLGVIKDVPFNAKRNFGLGIGIGYETNSYYSNLIAEEGLSSIDYRFPISDETVDRSKFETHAVAFPLELRWRTSTPSSYKFWRIYGGFKMEYLFSRRSKLRGDNDTSFTNSDIAQWQYGLTFNFGYNTWNLHLYWALSDFLEGGTSINSEELQIKPIRIGVIFYIL